MPAALVVKIAVGAESPERLSSGLSVAAAAVAAGVDVALWLANEASWLAVPDRAGDFPAEALELFDAVAEDATVSVCARCAERRGIASGDLIDGARIEGAAAFVAAITAPGTQALVY